MPELKKTLGLFEAIMYGLGVVIGVGVYVLIGRAAGLAGNAVWISLVLGATIATFTGLSYAELSSIFPKASAEYFYISRAFKNRFLAFLISWLLIFAVLMGISTVARGFGSYLEGITRTPAVLNAFLLILFLCMLNIRGIKISSRFNVFCVLATVIGLVMVIFFGMERFGSVDYFYSPYGIEGVFAASALIFFAYLGFENIASIAEETKSPRKNIPRAIVSTLLITTVIYVLVAISLVSLVSWQELATSNAPLTLALNRVSSFGGFVITLIALTATTSTVLGMMIYLSRITYGIASDKSLPEIFTLVHPKYKSPWVSIVVATVLSSFFLLVGDIAVTASLATFASLIAFIMINFSVIWLRKSKIERKFKVPLNFRNIPIPSVVGIILCSFMLFQFEFRVIGTGIAVLLVGIFYSLVLDRILKWLDVWNKFKRELTRFQQRVLK
jgi:APA family basic amino acid/polyamine antiporter